MRASPVLSLQDDDDEFHISSSESRKGTPLTSSKRRGVAASTVSAKKKKKSKTEAKDEEDDASSSEPSEWEVEAVVGRRKRNGRLEYQVEWKGTDKNGVAWPPSWEPVHNLGGSKELIAAWESESRAVAAARAAKPKATPAQKKKTQRPKRQLQHDVVPPSPLDQDVFVADPDDDSLRSVVAVVGLDTTAAAASVARNDGSMRAWRVKLSGGHESTFSEAELMSNKVSARHLHDFLIASYLHSSRPSATVSPAAGSAKKHKRLAIPVVSQE